MQIHTLKRMMHSYDENGNRIGPVVEGPGEQELYLHDGRWHLGTRDGEGEIERHEAEALARSWGEELPQ